MKLESNMAAIDLKMVKAIHLAEGALVEQDDLVVEMKG
jgi:acetyl/propionyl-CoA carboxylase alpha subunit